MAVLCKIGSAALRSNVKWQAIDGISARATLTDGGKAVGGIFRFDASGEFTAFETEDRWQDGRDDTPIPWRIEASDYRDMGGFRLATGYKAIWREKAGDFEYFRGRLGKVEYNVEEP